MSFRKYKFIPVTLLTFFLAGCPSRDIPQIGADRPVIKIGYMPLVSHMTIPVMFELSDGKFRDFSVQLVKFTSWTDMADALKKETLDAAIFLPPLGMKLRKQGLKYKCVSLSSTNGSAIVMGRWSGIENASDLKGRVSVIAVPNIYSIHHIILYKFLCQNDIKYGTEVKIASISPTDMLASMTRKETQGFTSSEPFCAAAEAGMAGRIIAFSKDIWPSHPGGILLVRQSLIEERSDLVQELVDSIVEAGMHIENDPESAARLCAPYFGVDQGLIEDVLRYPIDRVSYASLIPEKKDFERISYYFGKMGLSAEDLSSEDFIDDRFVRKAYEKIKK